MNCHCNYRSKSKSSYLSLGPEPPQLALDSQETARYEYIRNYFHSGFHFERSFMTPTKTVLEYYFCEGHNMSTVVYSEIAK